LDKREGGKAYFPETFNGNHCIVKDYRPPDPLFINQTWSEYNKSANLLSIAYVFYMRVSHFSDRIAELQRRIAVYDDEVAYRELFDTFYRKLVRFAVIIIKSEENAKEMVSDVFIRIWNKRKTIHEINNLRLYLYVSVKNSCISHLSRSKSAYKFIDLNDVDVEIPDGQASPEQQYISHEAVQAIEKAIDELPPRCKLIFCLVKDDKLKYKEIAELLHISVKTIDSQLAIALKKISAQLTPGQSASFFSKSG